MSSRTNSRRRRQPDAFGIQSSERPFESPRNEETPPRDEAMVLAESALKIETIKDLQDSIDPTQLDVIASELDNLVQTANIQTDDWCDLEESDIIKANLRVKQRFGDVVGAKYFSKHCDLFQKVSDMIRKVSQSSDLPKDKTEAFYESTKTFCHALLSYNEVLLTASDESEIEEAISVLQLVFDEDLFVSYSVLSVPDNREEGGGFVSGAFGVVKWALRYYTILYVTGMFAYNLYSFSGLFKGTNAVLDVCMKLFGCLCLAFIGSTYLAGKVIAFSLSLLNGIVRSLIPPMEMSEDGPINGGFRYLGTAFLSGWLVSIARMVCLITTEASSLGFRGFVGVVWDGINNVGWKSWTTILEVTSWIKSTVAENSMGMAQWFLVFIRDVIWKRVIEAVYGMVTSDSTVVQSNSTLGMLSNVDLGSVSKAALDLKSEATISQFKSGIVRSLAVLQNTLEDTVAQAPTLTASFSKSLVRLTQQQVIEELKLVPFAANATNAVNIMSYDDMIATLNTLSDVPRKPQLGKVKYLITQKYTSLLKIVLLAFIFLTTYYQLLRGV